jgi:hypothetical protein
VNIGSLYRVNEWHWLLFSSKEFAAEGHATTIFFPARSTSADAFSIAAHHSRKYNENVTYFSPDSYIVFLEEYGMFKKLLTSEGLIGWTWFDEDWNDCFEEVKNE